MRYTNNQWNGILYYTTPEETSEDIYSNRLNLSNWDKYSTFKVPHPETLWKIRGCIVRPGSIRDADTASGFFTF
jgi:hypothetical protein